MASVNRSVEHVEYDRMEKCLPVGKVPVEGGDTDAGSLSDCVSRGLAADLEDQLDRCVEESSLVPSSIGSYW